MGDSLALQVLSSFLITTISIAVFNAASVYGLVLGLWDVNTVIYTGTVLVANLRLALASRHVIAPRLAHQSCFHHPKADFPIASLHAACGPRSTTS